MLVNMLSASFAAISPPESSTNEAGQHYYGLFLYVQTIRAYLIEHKTKEFFLDYGLIVFENESSFSTGGKSSRV